MSFLSFVSPKGSARIARPNHGQAVFDAAPNQCSGHRRDGRWRTLTEIARVAGGTAPAVSALSRDFLKSRFGGHELESVHVMGGLWIYRLVVNESRKGKLERAMFGDAVQPRWEAGKKASARERERVDGKGMKALRKGEGVRRPQMPESKELQCRSRSDAGAGRLMRGIESTPVSRRNR